MKLLFVFLAFAATVLMSGEARAAYNDVSIGTGVTIGTSAGNLSTVSGTSSIESLTVASDSLSAGFRSGSTLYVSSADRKVLSTNTTNSLVVNLCTATSSTLGFEATGGTTISVTPSSSATCSGTASGASSGSSSSSSGGGGGGGGGSSTVAASAPASTTAAVSTTTVSSQAATSSNVTTSTPVVSSPGSTSKYAVSTTNNPLTRALRRGMQGDEVRRLQELLAMDPSVYPEGMITGLYGALTEKAVQKFQKKYGIVASGSAATTGYGRVGPKTLAKLNEVFVGGSGTGAIATPSSTPTLETPPSTSTVFVNNLGLGIRSEDVKRLQVFLNSDVDTQIADSGVGSVGNESMYFGALTARAVEKFQLKHGVAGPGETGYGRVGPKTRAKLEEIFGGKVPNAMPVLPSLPANQDAATTDAAAMIQQQINALLAQVQSLTAQVAAQGGQ